MISFSDQYGFSDQKPIQLGFVDGALRARIWNFFYLNELSGGNSRYSFGSDSGYGIVERLLDRLGNCFDGTDSLNGSARNRRALKGYLLNCAWNEVYDFVAFYLEFVDSERRELIAGGLNRVFEEQKSGYRIVSAPNDSFSDCPIAPITNEEELQELQKSLNTGYSSVNIALSNALQSYSDRNNPDYSNCIKESISSLESLLSHITGKDYTLSKNLKEMKKQGIEMHPAFCDAIDKLYAFASNTVRHGSKAVSVYADESTARFALITCSAAVNYLIGELASGELGGEIDA